MVFLRLPWLSARLGRPVLAAVEPFVNDPQEEAPAEAYYLVTRWPSTRFMAAMPSALPAVEAYVDLTSEARAAALGWESWVDRFLAEVTGWPSAELQRLGSDRDVLTLGVLRIWGWGADPDGAFRSIQEAAALLSLKLRLSPSDLLSRPFPAFAFDCRMLLGPQISPEYPMEELLHA